jgi:hypothetical protein
MAQTGLKRVENQEVRRFDVVHLVELHVTTVMVDLLLDPTTKMKLETESERRIYEFTYIFITCWLSDSFGIMSMFGIEYTN